MSLSSARDVYMAFQPLQDRPELIKRDPLVVSLWDTELPLIVSDRFQEFQPLQDRPELIKRHPLVVSLWDTELPLIVSDRFQEVQPLQDRPELLKRQPPVVPLWDTELRLKVADRNQEVQPHQVALELLKRQPLVVPLWDTEPPLQVPDRLQAVHPLLIISPQWCHARLCPNGQAVPLHRGSRAKTVTFFRTLMRIHGIRGRILPEALIAALSCDNKGAHHPVGSCAKMATVTTTNMQISNFFCSLKKINYIVILVLNSYIDLLSYNIFLSFNIYSNK